MSIPFTSAFCATIAARSVADIKSGKIEIETAYVLFGPVLTNPAGLLTISSLIYRTKSLLGTCVLSSATNVTRAEFLLSLN
jgi:hypothetical protein